MVGLASVHMSIAEPLRAWLLESDPALRWPVERDLLGEPAEVWQAPGSGLPVRGSVPGSWRCRTLMGSGPVGRTSRRASTSPTRGPGSRGRRRP